MQEIHVIRTGIFKVNTLIVSAGGKKAFVVDPAGCALSGDEGLVTGYLAKNGIECVGIVLTHSHFDHVTGLAAVKSAFPKAKIAVHTAEFGELECPPGKLSASALEAFSLPQVLAELERQPPADIGLNEGDTLAVLCDASDAGLAAELLRWKVLHTPGHTPGSICLHNASKKLLLSGDTLFDYGGYGRTDLAGGDERLICKSLSRLRDEIPEGTLVYPGHDSFGFAF